MLFTLATITLPCTVCESGRMGQDGAGWDRVRGGGVWFSWGDVLRRMGRPALKRVAGPSKGPAGD